MARAFSRRKPRLVAGSVRAVASLVCAVIAASASGQVRSVKVVYDHAANRVLCDKVTVEQDVCVVSMRPGDILSLQVINSLPGILGLELEKSERPLPAESAIATSEANLPPVFAAAFTARGAPRGEGQAGRSPKILYREINERLRGLQHAINHDLSKYEAVRAELVDLRTELLLSLNVDDDPAEVADALAGDDGGSESRGTKQDIGEWWADLTRLLQLAPPTLQSFRPAYYTYESDFDVRIGFKSESDLITSPTNFPMIAVRDQSGWKLSTSTGIAFSRLTDEEYTVRRVSETSAVTGQQIERRVAVLEPTDAVNPEAAMFVHFTPNRRGVLGRVQLTMGIGLDTSAASRTYAGVAYRLGSAGTILLGAAGGRVKRLSESVDPNNLGDLDPNAARRDVFDVDAMVGVSWSFGRQ